LGLKNTPIPSGLRFSRCPSTEVKAFVCAHHYSKTCSGANDFCFKAELDGILVGAIVYGFMGGNVKGACVLNGYPDIKKYREFRRLVMLDEVANNSESRFISWTLRWLQKNTDLLAIITFADSEQDHVGYVYQASNWLYVGASQPGHWRLIVNGTLMHTRTVTARYGTENVERLKAQGLDVVVQARPRKHRYVYVLRPELAPLLKWPVLPYPKTKAPQTGARVV